MQTSPVSPSMIGAQMKLYRYSILALEQIKKSKHKGTTAKELWEYLNETLPPDSPVSKASVINFLNTMKEKELIYYTERPNDGSYQRMYYSNINRKTNSMKSSGNRTGSEKMEMGP